ncbi:MAG: 4Fe-4S dicluster domain-containing protein [Terriglobales bacterium]
MSELVPIPLPLQLTRAFLEYEREGKIFDLPEAKFFRGLPDLDTSVTFHGHRASNPLGPAAGPHDQLVQNIVLSWLAGSRIIELKTVQIMDELKIPRPCIDATNVGYNVEWSQELKLEQSLREYVGAMMFLEILKHSRLLGDDFTGPFTDTIFDMSVGYNLEGIRSPRVRQWIESMKDATAIIDELRATLDGRWARYRDLPFPTRVSDTITLSTFHGCPAREIEGIVTFLLTEMDVHVCIKLNPTLLGLEHVRQLLHDVLGYRDIQVAADAFDHDLQFPDALDMIPRLDRLARSRGKRLAVKFSNTLVVKNHRKMFTDEVMYMSGAPLHVVTLNLVKKFRQHIENIPISFSAGLDQHNMANAVAMNFTPVTTCTDLLRPGGYTRLPKYMENLGTKMRELRAPRIADFVVRYAGQGEAAIERVVGNVGKRSLEHAGSLNLVQRFLKSKLETWLATPGIALHDACAEIEQDFRSDFAPALPQGAADALLAELAGLEQSLVNIAGLLNTPVLVDRTTSDPRYSWEKNKTVPRKIGSKLWLYDCIACDKCVPVCPNDANFTYDSEAAELAYNNYELVLGQAARPVPGGVFKIEKASQFANFADACNDCGNCDVFCPEDGGPQIEKPRFFSSLENYEKYAGRNGFFLAFDGERKTIHGAIAGETYKLVCDSGRDYARFCNGAAEVDIRPSDGAVLAFTLKSAAPHTLDLLPYLQLRFLLEAVSNPRHVNYANAAALTGVHVAKKGAVQG